MDGASGGSEWVQIYAKWFWNNPELVPRYHKNKERQTDKSNGMRFIRGLCKRSVGLGSPRQVDPSNLGQKGGIYIG